MQQFIRSATVDIPEAAVEFLFEPIDPARLVLLRRSVMSVASLWILSLLYGADWWFGPAGWLSPDVASRLATTSGDGWERSFMLSPLWWTSDSTLISIWLVVSLLLCIVAALGWGGRWSVAAAFGSVLFTVHRLPWATGSLEPLMVAAMGYLVIEPGVSGNPAEPRATARIGLRMMQIHVWLFLLFGLLTQCYSLTWWRGEAVWWLARTGHSNVLRPEWLHGKMFLINAITHVTVLVEFVAVAGLWSRLFRPIALACGLATAVVYALIADQFLYGLLIAALLQSFRVDPLPRRNR